MYYYHEGKCTSIYLYFKNVKMCKVNKIHKEKQVFNLCFKNVKMC